MNVTVLGAGAWGCALGRILEQGGHAVTLWARNPDHLASLQETRRNPRYLPDIELPATWRYVSNLSTALDTAECVVLAVPSKALRSVAAAMGDYRGIVVSVTKGIEYSTGLTMSGILEETLPHAQIAALSGPSLAAEVARGFPTAIVAASPRAEVAKTVQGLFHRPTFRVYTNLDLKGVELGGALKNVVAVAAGVGDGLGFGENSKAALITRGIVEIRRLGVACGAHPETFAGLSGLGDLTVTCFSKRSRNRTFGEQIGRGTAVADLLRTSVSVVEGYPTAQSAHQLAARLGVNTPIIDEVYALLYEGKTALQTVQDLIRRESKAELESDQGPP